MILSNLITEKFQTTVHDRLILKHITKTDQKGMII